MSEGFTPSGVLREIGRYELGPLGTNCYVVGSAECADVIVIDPGGDGAALAQACSREHRTIVAILITHGHFDHIGGVRELVDHTSAPVYMSAIDAPALTDPERFQRAGYPEVPACGVDHELHGGERLRIAGIELDVVAVPGHSPGHLAFVEPGIVSETGDGFELPPLCFIGDVIFRGSVGRTDIPFADAHELSRTLRMLRARLAPETQILPGHGEPTTMGYELQHNPFLTGL